MSNLGLKKILLVLLAFMVVFGMGMFKTQINGDRSFYKFTFQEGKEYTYTLDIGKMGDIKYTVQPNVMTIYARGMGSLELPGLRCEIEGLKCFASQGSKKGVWKEISNTDILKVVEGKNFIPLNLEIAVPCEDVKKHEVAKGKIKFFNNKKLYTTLNIRIVNSKY